ncbi:uncharacterized protein LOC123296020 [Chrysoperla carnea]|uniref:uncharacterized protein LOC123296020 n=1 Tax=Chrysoperla carnea TaxID=189513 RepID=UPI001D093A25|nr:uncharacterized protein LOC123296020 [Chrysoperla carnea]
MADGTQFYEILKIDRDSSNFNSLFDILQKVHLSNGHAGRDRMMKVLKSQYQNVTYRDVQLFLSLCETCIQKQKNSQKKGLIVEPMIFQDLISGVHLVADDSTPEQCQELQTKINESGNTEDFITVKEECISSTTSTMSQTEISYGRNSKLSLREILTNDNEFDAFGRNVSLQLQQMPLAAALETQELIQRIIRQKRVSILTNTQAITNMSDCGEN